MIDKKLVSAIHARFRQLRSGEVADNLRAQGVVYPLAWGVQSYRMREIALEFEANAELAEYLWNEEVRESKLLAPRLYPIGAMTREDAERWATGVQYAEIADQLAMHLLCRLPFAAELAERWLDGTQDDMHRYLALRIASRLDTVPAECTRKARQLAANADQPLWLRTAALWSTETV